MLPGTGAHLTTASGQQGASRADLSKPHQVREDACATARCLSFPEPHDSTFCRERAILAHAGPGRYGTDSGFGRQTTSRHASSPAYALRAAPHTARVRGGATPGPGSYGRSGGMGRQADSTRPSSARAVFSRAPRSPESKSEGPGPGEQGSAPIFASIRQLTTVIDRAVMVAHDATDSSRPRVSVTNPTARQPVAQLFICCQCHPPYALLRRRVLGRKRLRSSDGVGSGVGSGLPHEGMESRRASPGGWSGPGRVRHWGRGEHSSVSSGY